MTRKEMVVRGDVPPDCGVEEVPKAFREVFLDLIFLTDQFCKKLLDEEYQELCREMAILVCQEGSPVVRGKRASWASGIAYSVGWVNFLGDPSFEPYVRSEDIAKWFGVSVSTMHSKSKIIREGLELMPMDPEFTLPSRQEENPLMWMFEIGGFLVDIRSAPREVQEALYKQGLIPFVPATRDEQKGSYAVIHERIDLSEKRKNSKAQASNVAYQIKITLDGIKPPIWRRLVVPDCALDELHDIVQITMGWEDYHMHEFQAGDDRFAMEGPADFVDLDEDRRRESEVYLSELVANGHKKLRYWYDFGDDWRHTLLIEKILDSEQANSSPICLAGARACPPEDCGGIWGYEMFLQAIADPKHDQHDELLDWIGGDFDSEEFDCEIVNEMFAM